MKYPSLLSGHRQQGGGYFIEIGLMSIHNLFSHCNEYNIIEYRNVITAFPTLFPGIRLLLMVIEELEKYQPYRRQLFLLVQHP